VSASSARFDCFCSSFIFTALLAKRRARQLLKTTTLFSTHKFVRPPPLSKTLRVYRASSKTRSARTFQSDNCAFSRATLSKPVGVLARRDLTDKFRRRGARQLFKEKRRVFSHAVCQNPLTIRLAKFQRATFDTRSAQLSKPMTSEKTAFVSNDNKKLRHGTFNHLCHHETPNGGVDVGRNRLHATPTSKDNAIRKSLFRPHVQ